MKPFKAKLIHLKDIGRNVLITSGKEKAMQLLLSGFLRKKSKVLHPNIFCSPGKSTSRLIYVILETRLQGMFWGACDIKEAFLSVDNHKVIHELKKIGFPEYTADYMGLKKLDIVNFDKPHRGLPQGFNTSQFLYNLYINPIIKKMNRSRRWRVFIYVDDIFWCARSRKDARECRRTLRRLLERYGYKHRKMILSNKERKQTFIASPLEEFRALGFTFEPVRSA